MALHTHSFRMKNWSKLVESAAADPADMEGRLYNNKKNIMSLPMNLIGTRDLLLAMNPPVCFAPPLPYTFPSRAELCTEFDVNHWLAI